MAKNKFYAIRKGRKTGIFLSWDEAKVYVNGFPGAEYKGFPTHDEALVYLNSNFNSLDIEENTVDDENIVKVYVDGSFMEQLNAVGYGVVFTKNNDILFCDCGKVQTNDLTERQVIGEIHATIRAIQLCIANNIKDVVICYDYMGIECWANNSWSANKPLTKRYVEYFNKYKNQINISFKHIKSHSGQVFNEKADSLAKLGCTL